MSILDDARNSLNALEKSNQLHGREQAKHIAYLRHLVEALEPGPGPDPTPDPDPPSPVGQKVYYWNGSHDPNTFGHTAGVPMSRRGTGNIRVYYEAEHGLYTRPDQFRDDARRALADGCTHWVWDIEVGALFGLTPAQARAGIVEVAKVLPAGLAPKINFGHFHSWRGQTSWGFTPDQSLDWAMEAGVSFLSDWHYSAPGSTFVSVFDRRKQRGFTGEQVAIMDPRRSWDGNRPASKQDVNQVYSGGWSIGWFAPPAWRGVPINYGSHNEHGVQTPGMAEARRLYG